VPKLSRKSTLVLVSIMLLCGCGSQKRKEGIAELQKLQSAVHDLEIVVSAGTSQIEFSRRLTDSLLKIGDLPQSQNQILDNFSRNEQPTVVEFYDHLSQAVEAYKDSKEFFGDTHKEQLDPFDGDNIFDEKKSEFLQKKFPSLGALPIAVDYSNVPGGELGGKKYWKGDMLQALWRVASDEDSKAKSLMDRLAQNH
jgi:hypothetical protein